MLEHRAFTDISSVTYLFFDVVDKGLCETLTSGTGFGSDIYEIPRVIVQFP